jgi:nucleoside-diphosphate-sugar epimerase
MRIFLTGASGFVGSHLCDQLLKDGHEVWALVRNPAKVKTTHSHLTLISGDLSDSSLKWLEKLPSDIDKVIHTAGLVHSFNPADFFEVNTKGTERLIQGLKTKISTPLTFILISSLAAAGPVNKGEIRKLSDIDAPVSDYGLSKKLAEEFLLQSRGENWTVIRIRPPMVIGPRDTAVLDIFKMVRDGIVILPDLNSRKKEYSFVCVFDLVNTIILSISNQKDAVFYSSHDSVITFEEIIYAIQSAMNKKRIFFLPLPSLLTRIASKTLFLIHKISPHQLRLTPDKVKELLPFSWTCDASLTKKELDQTFNYTLKETIQITLEDYNKNSML